MRTITHRFIAVLVSASLFLSSCSHYQYASRGDSHARYTPSVTLKSGTHIEGADVRERTPFIGRDKIQIDSQKFLARDVAFYQTRSSRYANVGGSDFATQLESGKINVYQRLQTVTTTSYSGGTGGMGAGFHTSTHTRVYNYLQKGGDEAKVELFSRGKVRQYVAGNKPAMQLMTQSDGDARTAKIIGFAGLGVVATGLVMLVAGGAKAVNSESGSAGTGTFLAGAGLVLTSPLFLIPVSIFRSKAQRKAFEAIHAYNGDNR